MVNKIDKVLMQIRRHLPLALIEAFRLVFGSFGVFLESENKGMSFPSLHAPQTKDNKTIAQQDQVVFPM